MFLRRYTRNKELRVVFERGRDIPKVGLGQWQGQRTLTC